MLLSPIQSVILYFKHNFSLIIYHYIDCTKIVAHITQKNFLKFRANKKTNYVGKALIAFLPFWRKRFIIASKCPNYMRDFQVKFIIISLR